MAKQPFHVRSAHGEIQMTDGSLWRNIFLLVVKAFLQDGIVELKELPENRKNKGITLTEKGRQLCDTIVVPLLRQEKQAMTAIGEAESRELIRLLELYGKTYCKQIDQLRR